jgi:tetratricopeptide (TPR) repeat protein
MMNRVLSLALLLAAGRASAAETIALLPVLDPSGSPDSELLRLTEKLRTELNDRGASVQDSAETRARLLATPATEPELQRRFDLARKLCDAGVFREAAAAFRELIVAIENAVPGGETIYPLWVRAHLWRALAELGAGGDRQPPSEEMLSAIDDVLLVEPADSKLVDEFRERAPPRWREGFDTALRARRRKPLFQVTVTSSTPGAAVFIDTRPFGTAPITTLLPEGKYSVRGLAGGRRSQAAVFMLDSDRKIQLDFATSRNIRAHPDLTLAAAKSGMAATLLAVGTQLGVDRVFATYTEAKQKRLVASAYDVRSGALLREASIETTASALVSPLAQFLLTGRTSPRVQVSFPQPGTPTAAASGPSDREASKGDDKPVETSALAKVHYNKGRSLFAEGRYEAAILEFEAAVDAKSHPFTYYNIAECYERLGKPRERLRSLREYLRLLPTAEDRPAVLQTMTDLEATLRRSGGQTLQITSEPDHAEVWIDSEVRGSTPFRAELYLGNYELKVVKPGYRPFVQRVRVERESPSRLGLRLTAE